MNDSKVVKSQSPIGIRCRKAVVKLQFLKRPLPEIV